MAESVPWTKTFPALFSTTSAATWFVLAAPYRGTLDAFTISQEAGALDGYKVDLFFTKAVMLGTQVGDEEHYKIFPTKIVAPSAKLITDYTDKFVYRNQDKNPPADCERLLYLRITPTTPGVLKSFQVTMTVQPPLLQ